MLPENPLTVHLGRRVAVIGIRARSIRRSLRQSLHALRRLPHHRQIPRLELFRYRDRLNGKWVKGRGTSRRGRTPPPGTPSGRSSARRRSTTSTRRRDISRHGSRAHAELMRVAEPPPELQPHLGKRPLWTIPKRFLAAVFLRRYVTYRAKRERYTQMEGAARLFDALRGLICE